MTTYIVAGIGSWNRNLFDENSVRLAGDWYFSSTPSELYALIEAHQDVSYIFFPHWRWIVPSVITEKYNCVCFHMTDVPFGRGGSPLQNLIVRGFKDTILTALKMDEGMDSGPVYIKRSLALNGPASEIYVRAAKVSWSLIAEIVSKNPIPQAQSGPVTEFVRRTSDQSEIPTDLDITRVYDYIRMLDAENYPKAYMVSGEYHLAFENATMTAGEIRASVTIKINKE